MTYQNYRLCHGCRQTFTTHGQEINGIFYCNSCAAIRSNNRQIVVRRGENTPTRTVSVVHSSSTSQRSNETSPAINIPNNSFNSFQNSYSPNSTLHYFWRKHPIITVAALILIIFIVVSIAKINNAGSFSENQKTEQLQTPSPVGPEAQPKTQNKNQTNTKQQTSTQTNKESISEIINEKFSIPKYVSPSGLNARSGPGLSYKSLFVIPQNSIIYLSSTRNIGTWCVIKYKDKIGWVNKTFLRDFTIKSESLKIGNHNASGHWVTQPGDKLYAIQMEHLGIELTFATLNNYTQNTKLLLKIIMPDNKYIQGNKTPAGYSEQWEIKLQSGTYGYGTFNIPSYYYRYRPGVWIVKLYYENPTNPSNTLTCIATKQFTLY